MKQLFLLCSCVFASQIILAQDPAYPPAPAAPGNIVQAEYFFDTDPGFGNGVAITVTPAMDISNLGFSANVSALPDGNHILFIRSKDDWSITNMIAFLKGAPLPLQLLAFTGKRVNDHIQLNWVTENEINTSRFEIERSNNAVHFIKTGIVPALNTTGKNQYAFTDRQAPNGANYYRLKQVDKDGKFIYSPVIHLSNNLSELIFTVSPNPANNFINITYTGKKEMVTISIYDDRGRLVKQQTQRNELPVKVEVTRFERGVYFIQLADGETVRKARFIKQ